jgi:DNA-binding winged helix-turn-helix (wHTH) protein
MNTPTHVIYEFTPYRYDPASGKLLRAGAEVSLGPRLQALLTVFLQHPSQTLSKDELLERVWPGETKDEQLLFVSINNLRKRLGAGLYIENVSGHGYRFAPEVKISSPDALTTDEPPPPGGAVPLDSPFYLARPTDEAFTRALLRRDSLVLIKGARQVGKTSLLARGLQRAREASAVVVHTDLQHPSAEAFASLDKLLLTLGERIAAQLDLPHRPHELWSADYSASTNFENYLRREVFSRLSAPLVWGLDEIDRLFVYGYASEFFGLLRSWHNLRALEPMGPWRRLTLALAYATEAHLFITDLNQSPFNVGTKLTLNDFTLAQVGELNARYHAPLRDDAEVAQLFALVGGHPYLVQRALYELHEGAFDLATLAAQAAHDEGPFGEHLRRLLVSLTRDAELCAAVSGVLAGRTDLSLAHFYRLRSAGVLVGETANAARLRCALYENFLRRHLI